jgi:hypothetical protein
MQMQITTYININIGDFGNQGQITKSITFIMLELA